MKKPGLQHWTDLNSERAGYAVNLHQLQGYFQWVTTFINNDRVRLITQLRLCREFHSQILPYASPDYEENANSIINAIDSLKIQDRSKRDLLERLMWKWKALIVDEQSRIGLLIERSEAAEL